MARTPKTLKTILKAVFISKLAGIRSIIERNKAFHALSDEDKRKEIAFDALNLLVTSGIVAAESIYWGDKITEHLDPENEAIELESKKLQKELLKVGKDLTECAVCARGAVMLSTVRLGNCLSLQDTNYGSGKRGKIQGFDWSIMEAMESEFETGHIAETHVDNSDAKLGNILLNVIVNGDFKPSDLTDYVAQFKLKLNESPSQTNN